jgi:tetratricopeptide (TPR) repeat protein
VKISLQSLALAGTIGIYLFLSSLGLSDRGNNPQDAAYNLLSQGLLSGHLYVAKPVPPSLGRVKDPYDPEENQAARFGTSASPNGVGDFSLYNGRLYLCFGIAPALLYFIPAHLLTGFWMPHWTAAILFCSLGLIANISLANRIRKAHFPGFPGRLAAAFVPVLGLASYAPVLLARPDMWEIPIACGYSLVSAALLCLWEALEKPENAPKWLALASAALGAAFAARPTTLLAAPILAAAFLNSGIRSNPRAWVAAALPLAACGAAVALYNFQRFGSPFEFGAKYQLAGEYESRVRAFSFRYVWANLRLYLFQGVRWHRWFPFVAEADPGPLPAGHGVVERISGVLLNAPILWAGAAIPFFVRRARPGRSFSLLAGSAAWAAFASLGLLAFFFGTCARYQFEFAPLLALAAVLGVMALDQIFSGGTRAAVRGIWLAAAAFSSAFAVLFAVDRVVHDRIGLAAAFFDSGRLDLADENYSLAYALAPKDLLAREGLGRLHFVIGRRADAEREFLELIGDFPSEPKVWDDYAAVLEQEGRIPEAIEAYRQVLARFPNSGTAAHLKALIARSAGGN